MPRNDGVSELSAFLRAHGPVAPQPRLAAGAAVGDWDVAAFLGRGGNGEVYRVRQRALGTFAALKLLVKPGEAAAARFRLEARLLAESDGCGAFPRFHAFGETADGLLYLVTELLEPRPLPKDDAAVADWLVRVCAGAARLHALGYVHRDIKPGNILHRADGGPVLIDFGLVKSIRPDPPRRPAVSVVDGRAVGVGTPGYAAPEQFTGGGVSPATDIHALGMLANECFGGDPPAVWSAIIRRATSSIPGQRYADVAAFVAAIRHRHRARYLKMTAVAAVPVLILFLVKGYFLLAETISERLSNERQTELDAIEREAQREADADPQEFFQNIQ